MSHMNIPRRHEEVIALEEQVRRLTAENTKLKERCSFRRLFGFISGRDVVMLMFIFLFMGALVMMMLSFGTMFRVNKNSAETAKYTEADMGCSVNGDE